ncbi:MAG: hypothetical protein Sapg2KO_45720 [Saprospiraceae bacterium]
MLQTYQKVLLLGFFTLHISAILWYNLYALNTYQKKEVFEQLSQPGQKAFLKLKHILPSNIPMVLRPYAHFVGTDTGYSLFAPNVPSAIGVMFELKDSEGNTTIKFPELESRSGLDRFTGNLSTYKSFEEMRPLLAYGWASRMLEIYPDYTAITVIIGSHRMPNMQAYQSGERSKFLETVRYEFELD